jgi:hypothetical protein
LGGAPRTDVSVVVVADGSDFEPAFEVAGKGPLPGMELGFDSWSTFFCLVAPTAAPMITANKTTAATTPITILPFFVRQNGGGGGLMAAAKLSFGGLLGVMT